MTIFYLLFYFVWLSLVFFFNLDLVFDFTFLCRGWKREEEKSKCIRSNMFYKNLPYQIILFKTILFFAVLIFYKKKIKMLLCNSVLFFIVQCTSFLELITFCNSVFLCYCRSGWDCGCHIEVLQEQDGSVYLLISCSTAQWSGYYGNKRHDLRKSWRLWWWWWWWWAV